MARRSPWPMRRSGRAHAYEYPRPKLLNARLPACIRVARAPSASPPMKLIVGLGNPGRQFVDTPHNVGFQAVDLLGERARATWSLERRFEAEICEAPFGPGGARVTLMKPLTYMNLSGRSVGGFCQKNGVAADEILVLSDDLHLPLGQLRLRPSGSHGGQKGLLSIIQTLGTLDFPRLKIGVRPDDLPEIRDNLPPPKVPPRSAKRFVWLRKTPPMPQNLPRKKVEPTEPL